MAVNRRGKRSSTNRRSRRGEQAARRPDASRRRWAIGAAAVALALAAVVVWSLTRGTPRPTFDAAQAFDHLERQVAFGPRIPGTAGHAAARAYFTDVLGRYADQVGVQPFQYVDRRDSSRLYEGFNIVASFKPEETGRRVLLSAHYDTRPWADKDPDPSRRDQPVPGANDGASGVAVLLEVARLLDQQPPDVGVDIVLFDLEDLGDDAEGDSLPADRRNPFAIGSARFVEQNPAYRPSFGLLLDMVCDRNLRIMREAYSFQAARPIVEKVWKAARRVGADAFVDETGPAVYDDHIAFLQAGIPVIDLIHAPFPPTWHTTADTPDACSAASLQQVGDVVLETVYRE